MTFVQGIFFIMDFFRRDFKNIFFVILTTDNKSAGIEITINICWLR